MKYDIVICGAGVAGLWLLNTLSQRGFNVLLLEKNVIGGIQTLASQGMIHGGHKYIMQGSVPSPARAIAAMPDRWNECFLGTGDIDLRDVRALSETQCMWPAGNFISGLSVAVAAALVNTKTKKLEAEEYPAVLRGHKGLVGSVYELPERVLDIHSLVSVLSGKYIDRIKKGEANEVRPDGTLLVSGTLIEAQLIIFATGQGNESALALLGAGAAHSQQRPLRQIMVRTIEHSLYGHGIVSKPKPRVTVTSHPAPSGGYVWYLGGGVAEEAAGMEEEEAIRFAKQEMQEMFPSINWSSKEWATWYGVRAEVRDPKGLLGSGPAMQEYGNVLIVWPTKLTFAPALSDSVLARIEERGLRPKHTDAAPAWPTPSMGTFPWENARWSQG